MSAPDKISSDKKEVPKIIEVEDDDDEDDNENDDDYESIFEMLKNKNNKVPVASLLSWGEIKELIDSEELTLEELNGFVREVSNLPEDSKKKPPTELDKQQFMDLVDLVAEKMNGEEISAEQLTTIYNDLKGKDKELSMKKFRDWDEIRDLLSEDLITEEILNATIEDVCEKKIGQIKTIDASQFISIVSQLEETMESSALDLAETGDDDEEEDSDAEEDDDDDDDVLDDTLLRETFEELRGKKKAVTIQAFKDMDDIKDMLEAEYITAAELGSIIDTVYGKEGTSKLGKTEVDFNKFAQMIEEIDKIAGIDMVEDEEDEEEDGEIELSEEEVAEIFDELKDNSGKVSLKTFFAWDAVTDAVSEGSISKEKLNELIDSVCGAQGAAKKSSTKLDLDQFSALTSKVYKEISGEGDIIDVEGSDVSKSDRTSAEEAEQEDEDDDDDDSDIDSDNDDEVLEMVYDDLKDKDGKLSLKTFLAWEDLKEMVSHGITTMEEVKALVAEICGKKASNSLIITKEQFFEIVKALDDPDSDESDDTDEEMVMSDEEATEEIFNELSKDPKKEKIAMKDFLAWDEIRDLLKNDLIDMETLRILVSEVGAKMNGNLTKEQFSSLLELIDETSAAMAPGADDEDDGDGRQRQQRPWRLREGQ